MVEGKQESDTPDVVVIGGGPAGSTASTLIAQQGYRVVLFERERFPRFHIGESLIPETYWVFERLNMLPKMKRSRFVKKRSVQFFSANGKGSRPFYFADNKDHPSSQTWQVERGEFDQMMLENAREHGVVAHEGVRVLDVLFESGRAVGLTIKDEDGSIRQVRARAVVDASGEHGLLMKRLGLRIWDPVLNKGAIWTYYEGAHRDEGPSEGATLVLQTANKNGWFWYIPLRENKVSVGVVAPFDYLFNRDRVSHEQTFNEEMEQCCPVKERLSVGHRVTGHYATRDFSYRSKQVAGDGWVLVGDAFGFLDPLYSSGILLALKSGQLAADAIVEGFAKGDTSAAQLGNWGPAFNRGVDRMRRLVCEYYDGFSFGNFVRNFPDLQGAITDLLIGDLFDDDVDRVWKPMESLYEEGKARIPEWHEGELADHNNGKMVPEGKET